MKRMTRYGAMMSGCLLVAGCSAAAEPEAPKQASVTRVQELGESTRTVWVRGEGAGLIPSYAERVGAFVFNRIRTAPHHLGLTDMEGNPILPNTPAQFQAYMAEAGRWQAQHNLETGCNCTAEVVGYNPMDPATRENEKYVGASCCEMGIKDGVPTCVSPLVACKDPKATLRTERWKLLNPGPAQILDEQGQVAQSPLLTGTQFAEFVLGNAMITTAANTQAFAMTQSELTVVPEECREDGEEEPPNSCPTGVCTEQGTDSRYCTKDGNPECIGVCKGAAQEAFCVLSERPERPECDPATFRKDLYLGVLTGVTQEPSPALSDGIHHQLTAPLGQQEPQSDLDTVFGLVPAGQLSYAVHYYERNGTPEGTPRSVKVVINDQCTDLQKLATEPNLPGTNTAAPFRGATYATLRPATAGCHKYVFVARDGDGFEYTYPEYGSLQALVGADGVVLDNDESCPIWTEARVSLTCAGAGVDCDAGDTRVCYTGRHGTQDNGVCKPGTETCVNGRWSGACDGEVKPSEEICDDKLDNDCNGGVDEGCPVPLEPPDADMGGADMGGADMGGTDMGSTADMGGEPPQPSKDEDDGCSTAGGHGSVTPSLFGLAIGLLGVGWRRRRSAQS